MQQDLITGSYDRSDCEVYSSEEVAAAAERNLADNTGFLARLGWSDEAVKQGSAFLLVYAPGDTDAERVMNDTLKKRFERLGVVTFPWWRPLALAGRRSAQGTDCAA